jgi:hypothetical protein
LSNPLQGFFLSILWCNQSGNHPENNLAKFGYILDMKVGKKKKKTEYFFILGWNLSSKFDDLKK